MHQRLRTRARRIEREPEPPQPTGGRPARRSLAIPHGKMLRKPGEQNIPALVADRSRRIFEQTQPNPGWFLAVLLKEFNHQPLLRVEVPLARNKTSKIGKS